LKKIAFTKYHGAGNDFIIIDNRERHISFQSSDTVAQLCNRRTGIGADGLILLETSGNQSFKMIYYNSDGNEGSMCGNGGRCITTYAFELGVMGTAGTFEAIDGIHEFKVLELNENQSVVSVKMNNVGEIFKEEDNYILDTGSPHYVTPVQNIETIDVEKRGKEIRNSEKFRAQGINVNFVSVDDHVLKMRTYERGVEAETLSCGTGTVAVAIAMEMAGLNHNRQPVEIITRGGILTVSFRNNNDGSFSDIWLTGPVTKVYSGITELKVFK
jgi:diaminopimelate epimerase